MFDCESWLYQSLWQKLGSRFTAGGYIPKRDNRQSKAEITQLLPLNRTRSYRGHYHTIDTEQRVAKS